MLSKLIAIVVVWFYTIQLSLYKRKFALALAHSANQHALEYQETKHSFATSIGLVHTIAIKILECPLLDCVDNDRLCQEVVNYKHVDLNLMMDYFAHTVSRIKLVSDVAKEKGSDGDLPSFKFSIMRTDERKINFGFLFIDSNITPREFLERLCGICQTLNNTDWLLVLGPVDIDYVSRSNYALINDLLEILNNLTEVILTLEVEDFKR